MFNAQIERVECRPWGLFGGLSAAGNQVVFQRNGEAPVVHATGKVFAQHLRPGDRYMLRSGGGGGFGCPLDRKLEDVEHDVREGYVSIAAAREQYGAVIDPATMRARRTDSAALRARMRAAGLPRDVPFESLGGRVPAPQIGEAALDPVGTELKALMPRAFQLRCRCC